MNSKVFSLLISKSPALEACKSTVSVRFYIVYSSYIFLIFSNLFCSLDSSISFFDFTNGSSSFLYIVISAYDNDFLDFDLDLDR